MKQLMGEVHHYSLSHENMKAYFVKFLLVVY